MSDVPAWRHFGEKNVPMSVKRTVTKAGLYPKTKETEKQKKLKTTNGGGLVMLPPHTEG